jgi:Ca2+-binding RTX toxin-like protein
MTTYNWSDFVGGETVSPFDPNPGYDVLHFDDSFISAGLGPNAGEQFDFFTDTGAESFFSFGGVEVEVAVDPRQITTTNVTFASGSLFIFGDDAVGIVNDDVANTIIGGAEGDWLVGAGGADSVFGDAGNDMLVVVGAGVGGTGAYGNDTLNGGAGVDQVFYDGALLAINANLATGDATGGRAGNSTLKLIDIEQIVTGEGNDTLTGSSTHNLLYSQEGNDRLTGAAGNDTLDGGIGTDTMIGGNGNDSYVVSAAGDVVTESANQGTDTVYSSVTRTLGANQENLTLTGSLNRNGTGNTLSNVINGNSGNNTLNGDAGNDTINGSGGNDTLHGGGGNDSIDGGDGDDSMLGGTGNDTYRVIEAADKVVELALGGTDTIITNRSIDMAAHVENLIWLPGGDGVCNGNAEDNVMSASGGAGTLTMDGKGGSDTVSYAGQNVTVVVDLDAGTGTSIDFLISMENATGGNFDDTLTGNAEDNILNGSVGVDTMTGGFGDDTYIVDDAGDVVLEENNDPATLAIPGGEGGGPGLVAVPGVIDTVIASINYSLGGLVFVENLVLTGSASTATGNALANRLTGNAGSDTLDGGDGNDTLDGGADGDVLMGGIGNDTLVWHSADLSVNGGGGSVDILTVNSGNLNLKNIGNDKITNIERINLTNASDNTLTLGAADVLAINSTGTLKILGDTGDVVSAVGFTQLADSGGFQRFQNGGAMLLVDQEINVIT